MEIEIHYNCFESIKEQLDRQGFSCDDIGIFEQAKDNIMFLYVQGFITDKEKDNACKRLHKKIISVIRKGE